MKYTAFINSTAAFFLMVGLTGAANASHSVSRASGLASVYSGGRTANGEHARAGGLTAAHRSLPFGTLVRVTNRQSGRSVVVRINDRGPFVRGRVIDLTPAAAHAIGCSGLARVTLSVVGRS
jgi:rare lipoprotein A